MPDAPENPARPHQDTDATSASAVPGKGTAAAPAKHRLQGEGEASGRARGDAPATSSAVAQATAAVERKELWVARDVLTAHVREARDVEALRLLGEVHHGMGDLPAAGAAWFGAGVKGPEVDAAVEAWRASHGDDFAAMWRSLPRSVRQEPRSKKVEALRAKALEARDASDAASAAAGAGASAAAGEPSGSGGIDAAQIIAWVIAAFVVVCAVVGLVQILRWMVPGG